MQSGTHIPTETYFRSHRQQKSELTILRPVRSASILASSSRGKTCCVAAPQPFSETAFELLRAILPADHPNQDFGVLMMIPVLQYGKAGASYSHEASPGVHQWELKPSNHLPPWPQSVVPSKRERRRFARQVVSATHLTAYLNRKLCELSLGPASTGGMPSSLRLDSVGPEKLQRIQRTSGLNNTIVWLASVHVAFQSVGSRSRSKIEEIAFESAAQKLRSCPTLVKTSTDLRPVKKLPRKMAGNLLPVPKV
jgi:hypothetical protein